MHAIAAAPEIGSRSWISALEASVDGRVVDVTATSSGRIAQIFVAEGELVGKGATLLELDDVVSALGEVLPHDWRGFFEERVFKISPHAPLGGLSAGGWKLAYSAEPNVSATQTSPRA